MLNLLRKKTYAAPELTEKLHRNIQIVLKLKEHIQSANQSAVNAASSLDTLNSQPSAHTSDHARVAQALTSCAKYLDYAKGVLVRPVDPTGAGQPESNQAQASPEYVRQLIEEFTNSTKYKDFLYNLIQALDLVGFESKKEIAAIFGALVRWQSDMGSSSAQPRPNAVVEYIRGDKRILKVLIDNYSSQKNDVALNSGAILRDCIKDKELANIVLTDHYTKFFEYANLASFDILSDAFSTFRDLMTKHKQMVKKFLEQHYEDFFKQYNTQLIKSDNYVTKRQSIKLISEVLLDRLNFQVMSKYVADVENLRVIMTLLLDRSDAIKFEAFHVFKIFVANPNKTEKVEKLLLKNQDILIVYLKDFQVDQRQEDEQFQDERNYLIKQIRDLQKKVPTSTGSTSHAPSAASSNTSNSTQEPSGGRPQQGSPVDWLL